MARLENSWCEHQGCGRAACIDRPPRQSAGCTRAAAGQTRLAHPRHEFAENHWSSRRFWLHPTSERRRRGLVSAGFSGNTSRVCQLILRRPVQVSEHTDPGPLLVPGLCAQDKYSPQFCESFATNQISESARHFEWIIWNGQGRLTAVVPDSSRLGLFCSRESPGLEKEFIYGCGDHREISENQGSRFGQT